MSLAPESRRREAAESALVAICVHLCMVPVRDRSFALWLDLLGEVAADCLPCSAPVACLRNSAAALAAAAPGLPRDNALARLRVETAAYYMRAAGHRTDLWQRAKGRKAEGAA